MSLSKTFVRAYDLAATAYIYLATSDPIRGMGKIKTVGSSTTVSAVAAEGTPFSRLIEGDEIIVVVDGAQERRLVVTKAGDQRSVVVNSAVNWENSGDGYTFAFRTIRGGTAATDGWHSVKNVANKAVKVEALLITGTGGIDYSIEGRFDQDGDAVPIQLATGNIASVTFPDNGAIVPVMEGVSGVRVGLKWGTADGAGPDSVSVYLTGEAKW